MLQKYDLIDKCPIKSAYPHSSWVKGASNAPHPCVFVGSCSAFLMGYAWVYYNFSFLGQYVPLLWLWALVYVMKL